MIGRFAPLILVAVLLVIPGCNDATFFQAAAGSGGSVSDSDTDARTDITPDPGGTAPDTMDQPFDN